MAIEFYKEFGDLGYLANYANYGFWKNGIYYPTAEHYYQSEKFDDINIKQKIIMAQTPKEASIIGRNRNLKRKENFKQIKNQVMYQGVLEKFRQNPEIRSQLIETGNQEICEMTVKENYWGVGPNHDGKNYMGKILMKVRNQLKKEVLNNILLKSMGKKVYIIGHTHPDADSLFSSMILAQILQRFGIDAIAAVRDENFVDEKLIRDYSIMDYEVITEYKNKKFILVDHNSCDNIPKENIIGAIDHHRITSEIEDLIEIEYASCGLLIYDLFSKNYSFTEELKKLVALTVLSDTEYLTSSRFNEESKKIYEELNISLDEKEYQKKYFQTTNFSKSILDNLKRNYKEYEYQGMHIRRSFISSYHEDCDKYYSNYILEIQKNDIDLLIWCDYERKITHISYNGKELILPYFTSSTNLVLKYLEKEKYLNKIKSWS